MTQSFKRPLKA
jgi:dynein heavy chain